VGRPFKSVGMPPGEREHERRKRGTCDFDRGNEERRGRNSEAAGTTHATERTLELCVLDGVDRIDAGMLEGNRDTIVRMGAGSADMVMRMVRVRMSMMVMNARMRVRLQILCKLLMSWPAQDHRRRGRHAQRDRYSKKQDDQQVQRATHGESITQGRTSASFWQG